MSKCIGCGISLQNKAKDELGFTNNLDNLYCERCFKTIHYNEERKVPNINNDKIINKVNKLNLFTLFITDLLSINSELIDVFNKISNPKVLIINKCDIIPHNLSLKHLEQNIKRVYNLKEDVFFISVKKNFNMDKVMTLLNQYQKIILCGETSSGKSTLINKLFNTSLTTSKYNNTTLDFIKLKYDNYLIYDTPGIIIDSEKKNVDNIKIIVKKLSNDFVLTIDNLKFQGNGFLTLIVDSNKMIQSKKEDEKLNYQYNITKNSDITFNNGFIYLKENTFIKTNENVNFRDSIIK